jgi:hypothetical protein
MLYLTPEILQAVQTPVMAFPFAAIAGAVIPSLVGGLFNKGENDKAQDRAAAASKQDRQYYLKDKQKDRQYAAALTKADRAYAERLARKDRVLALGDKARDAAAFRADRSGQQKLANTLAERQAASRGLDFAQLRDDAIKAGFNPLTALGFANSYSREIDYHETGGTYSGGSAQPGSTAVMPSHEASPGNFVSSGSGYASSFAPRLSSGDFVAQALDAGISTYFNSVSEQDDVTYQTIANQVASGQIAREVARNSPGQNFGFDLTKTRPYKPATAQYTAPPFAGVSEALMTGGPHYGDRDYSVEPEMNIPVVSDYAFPDGTTLPGLSQDVEWSEPAQMLNEAFLLERYATSIAPSLAREAKKYATSKAAAWQKSKPYLRGRGANGFGSEVKTGSRPRGPVLKGR